jgi:hypothetical protein
MMADKPPNVITKISGELLHIPKSRSPKTSDEDRLRDMELSISAHFFGTKQGFTTEQPRVG